MRNVVIVATCVLLLSGCASPPDPAMNAVASIDTGESVRIYDATPVNALSLGPIAATACDRPRDVATKRLLSLAQRQGANGISELKCTDEGMSFSCWSKSKCEAIALNIPPPPPPRPVTPPPRAKRVR